MDDYNWAPTHLIINHAKTDAKIDGVNAIPTSIM